MLCYMKCTVFFVLHSVLFITPNFYDCFNKIDKKVHSTYIQQHLKFGCY